MSLAEETPRCSGGTSQRTKKIVRIGKSGDPMREITYGWLLIKTGNISGTGLPLVVC